MCTDQAPPLPTRSELAAKCDSVGNGGSAAGRDFKQWGRLLPTLRSLGDAAVIPLFLFLAGLMGACGVGLAAAAAHGASTTGLDSAAWLLLFHATALLGAASLAGQHLLWRPLALAAMSCFVAGAVLFAGDIAMRAFAGNRLFPMAAPAGGTLLLVGWLVLAAAALAAMAATPHGR